MFTGTRTKLIISFIAISLLAGALSLATGWRTIQSTVLREAEQKAAANLLAAELLYLYERDRLSELVYYCCESVFASGGTADAGPAPPDLPPPEKLYEGLRRLAESGRTDFTGYYLPGTKELIVWGPDDGIRRALEAAADHVSRIENETAGFLPAAEQDRTGGAPDVLAVAALIPKKFGTGPEAGTVYIFAGEMINEGGWFSRTIEAALFPRSPMLPDITGDIRIIPRSGIAGGGSSGDVSLSRDKETVTAYKSVEDIFGNPSALLVSSVHRSWFDAIIKKTVRILLIISIGSMLIAAAIGSFIAHTIYKPVHDLIEAGRQVSRGNLNPSIGPIRHDDLGHLQMTFLEMTRSLRERDEQIHRASESKLLQSEKQASIGRLAAGVAHEINNPLTGVLTFTHLLLKRKGLDEEMREDLETIANSTERVREIVKGLLDFSRQTEMRPQLADINQLIQHTLTLVGNQALVKGVMICFHPQEDLPKRTVDKNQIESVLINILINAIDSTPKGGHVVVTTSTALPGEIKPYPQKGIEISITDTGSGIPPEHMHKLFDPFFTTKEVGKGTGLGLAVSYGIMEKHRGTIRVKSKVDEGSTFILWLPLEDKEI